MQSLLCYCCNKRLFQQLLKHEFNKRVFTTQPLCTTVLQNYDHLAGFTKRKIELSSILSNTFVRAPEVCV